MGRLSSDAFFNTFDRIKQRNYNKLPAEDIIDTRITGDEFIGKQPKLSTDKYEIRPTKVEKRFVDTSDGPTSNEIISLYKNIIDEDGVVQKVIAPEDVEADNMITGWFLDKYFKFKAHFPALSVANLRNILTTSGHNRQTKADKNTVDILTKLQNQMSIKNEKIFVTPILQQQRVMEQFP